MIVENEELRTNHVVSLHHIGRFKSFYDQDPIPHGIEPHCEMIEFLFGGGAFFEVDGVMKNIGAGAILWHMAGDQTVYRTDLNNPYECLVVKFEVLGPPRRQVPRYTEWDDVQEGVHFAHSVLRDYHLDDYDRKSFCHYLYNTFMWKAHLYTRSKTKAEVNPALRRVLSVIDEDYRRPLSLEDMSQVAGISVPHLHALFQEQLKVSPHQHLIERRLQAARHLLVTSDRQVKDMAGECGFKDSANFCRSFSNRFGISPGQYRKKYLGHA